MKNKQYLYNETAEELEIKCNYIELARLIVSKNYGSAKMIEALIIARKEKEIAEGNKYKIGDQFRIELEKILYEKQLF